MSIRRRMPTLVMLTTTDATFRGTLPFVPAFHPAAVVQNVGASLARLLLPVDRLPLRLRIDVRLAQGQGVALLLATHPLPIRVAVPARHQRVGHRSTIFANTMK